MQLSSLTLRHFRNYLELNLSCGPRLNVLVGPNAQGKTNLLEAIFLLSTGKSPRVQLERELIMWGEQEAVIEGTVTGGGGPVTLRVELAREKRKRAWVNGNEVTRRSDFMGFFTTVFFTPDDLQMVKGAPAQRRRYLDLAMAQVDPTYRRYLFAYQRAMMERNSLLKNTPPLSGKEEEWEVWTGQMVMAGVHLVKKRMEAVGRLSLYASAVQQRISGGAEELSLVYVSSFLPKGILVEDPVRIEAAFWEKLRAIRQEEFRRGTSLAGPHRDDLFLAINGQDLRLYGSQGQQRTAALALKLAELEFMRESAGEYPVLLLDDVLSELDADRRRDLLDLVRQEVQIFVTGTDLADFPPAQLREGAIFTVREGQVLPVQP